MAEEVYIDSKAPNAETQWLLMNEKVRNTQEKATAQVEQLRYEMKLEIEQVLSKIDHNAAITALIKQTNETAVSKVEREAKEYRAAQNEWRGALSDSAERKADIGTVNDILKRVEKLESARISDQGRGQLLQYVPWVFTIVFLIIAVLSYIYKK